MGDNRRLDPACDVGAIVRDPVRLAAVRRTGLLDSAPEESFDRLTRIASRLVGAPAAFVALIDEARDFYKSTYGFGEPLASRRELTGLTFCHYAVAGSDPLVIPDARAHPVYSQVPTVENLGVAAYLGIPLVTSSGLAIGSFCVIDFEPHDWRALDVDLVTELAASTLREIELRLALRDAESAGARAREAIHAREAIVAILSHDLRNPIHAVRSAASTLIELKMPDADRRRFVEIIHRSSESMSRLVSDLLDISSIEAGGLRLETAPVDSAALLEATLELHAPNAANLGLELRLEAPRELPPVMADRSRVHQVLASLVENAIRSTPAGGHVVIRAARRDDDVVFAVSDTGESIPPDHLPHIFDRSWHAAGPNDGGRGLALALVDGIVRAHGGAVAAESKPGEGKTFSFTIPSAPDGPMREDWETPRPRDERTRPAT